VPAPSLVPTYAPSQVPVPAPSLVPTYAPSQVPVPAPSLVPTFAPSQVPVPAPSSTPTLAPTQMPTQMPTSAPTSFDNGLVATISSEMVVTTTEPKISNAQKQAFKEGIVNSYDRLSSTDQVKIKGVDFTRRRLHEHEVERRLTSLEATILYNFTITQAGNYNVSLLLAEVESELFTLVNASNEPGGFADQFSTAAAALNTTSLPLDIAATDELLDQSTVIQSFTVVTRPPTSVPTSAPTQQPTKLPVPAPTGAPSHLPTISHPPTPIPSISPAPTATPKPTMAPTAEPTLAPSISTLPTSAPTTFPSRMPVAAPTSAPFPVPSRPPTPVPSPSDKKKRNGETASPSELTVGLFAGFVGIVILIVAAVFLGRLTEAPRPTFQLGDRYTLNRDGVMTQQRAHSVLVETDLEAVGGRTEAVDQRTITLQEQEPHTIGMRQAHL